MADNEHNVWRPGGWRMRPKIFFIGTGAPIGFHEGLVAFLFLFLTIESLNQKVFHMDR